MYKIIIISHKVLKLMTYFSVILTSYRREDDFMEKDPKDYYEPINDEEPTPSQQPNFIMLSKPEKEDKTIDLSIVDQDDDTKQVNFIEDVVFEEKTDAFDNSSKKRKKKKREGKFFARHRVAFIVVGCILLSIISGFGGAYFAIINFANPNDVQYQKVIRTSADGDSGVSLSIKEIVANTENSVVEIQTESMQNGSFMREYISTGAGSGVIFTADGYIVTNNHVIAGANKITVKTKDGNSYDAELIGTDAKTDLAVIKIDASDLSPVILGSSGKLAVGDMAVAIGNPLGELGGSVSQGIISALDREITIDNETMTLLQTDTAINPGNSGGGLFNQSGELIGIVNAKSSGSDIEGLGFAIPIDTAKTVIEELIDNGYVSNRAQLGVSLQAVSDEMTAQKLGVSRAGIYIAAITEGSSADKAGLEVKDRIISIDDKEITSVSDVKMIIDEHSVGDELEIQISRNDRLMKVKVTLSEAVQEQSS